jgi:hypothetical protein
MQHKLKPPTKLLLTSIVSLIIAITFYIILSVCHLSKPIYIRTLLSLLSFSGTAFAFFCFSAQSNKSSNWIRKIGYALASVNFLLLLFAIWSNASFTAKNWLLVEVSSALVIICSFSVLLFNYFSKK